MKFNWGKILSPDETLQKEFGVSSTYLTVIVILTIIVTIIVAYQYVPAGIFLLLLGSFYCFYLKRAKYYAFTTKKVYLVDSFIGTNIASIDYGQITDIQIEQSLVDQIFGWGTLIINTAGTHAPEMAISFVDNPQGLKQTLDKIRATQTSPAR